MKLFKPVVAGLAILIAFSLTIFAQSPPEPPCDFSDPCLSTCNSDWQEIDLQFTPCPTCTITITYYMKACECQDENGVMRDHFGIYLKGFFIPTECLTSCFTTYEDAVDAASQYFFDQVMQPKMSSPNTEAIEFKTKACYKLVDILETDLVGVEPCEGQYGCCEYLFGTFTIPWFGKIRYWYEEYSIDVCDVWGPVFENCYSMCGKFGTILSVWNETGILKPVALDNYNFSVSPNPVKNSFELHIPSNITGNIDIQIFDTHGKCLYSNPESGEISKVSVNTSGFSTGTYYIIVNMNGECVYAEKIIILQQ